MKGRTSNLLKVGLSLLLLAFLLTRIDLRMTLEAFRGAGTQYLLAALVLYLVSVPLRAYRWQGLLSALRVGVSLSRLISLYFVGTFFNNILPTGVGGDVVRAYELAKDGTGGSVAASTVLADRATGMLVLLALALVSTVFSSDLVSAKVSLGIAAVSLGTFAGVGLFLWDDLWHYVGRRLPQLLVRPIRKLVDRQGVADFYSQLQVYRGRPVLKALFISLIFNLMLIAVNYFIALSLNVKISLWYFLLFVPLISFSLMLPISFSGLGVREGAYVLLFGQAGVAAPVALAMSLAFYALNVAIGLVGGVIYALQGLGQWATGEETG